MGSMGLEVIEIVIGLIFIYLLVSILVTLVNEIVSTNLQMRSRFLKKGIIKMLEDDALTRETGVNLANAFYNHPTIRKLEEAEKPWLPFLKPKLSYISPQVFSSVLIDILGGYKTDGDPVENFKTCLKELPEESQLRDVLLPMVIEAESDFNKVKRSIASWFDDVMVGVTNLYKRYNQYIVFGYGLLAAALFNVDTVKIGEELSKNPDKRIAVVEAAGNFIEKENSAYVRALALNNDSLLAISDSLLSVRSDTLRKLTKALIADELTPSGKILGIGWDLKQKSLMNYVYTIYNGYPEHLPGWFLTALAVSLGSPFWFDMLKRLMMLRGAVKRANGKE